MAAKKHPGAPKQQSLGTRCGKLLNKLEKLDRQRAEALEELPAKIDAKFDEKRKVALSGADADVLERLGLDK